MNIIASVIFAATVPATTNLAEQVAIMWAAHTNRIVRIESLKKSAAMPKSAVDRVRENAKRRKSAMGRSTGGVKK